jgi:hypothetical protein
MTEKRGKFGKFKFKTAAMNFHERIWIGKTLIVINGNIVIFVNYQLEGCLCI